MIMDEQPLFCYYSYYNQTWHLSPRTNHMSWDPSSYMEERDLHLASSSASTPQRDIDHNSDTNNAQPSISPYPVGHLTHGTFGIEAAFSEAPYGYGGFPEAPSGYGANYAHASPAPPAMSSRRLYEECEPQFSPPPKLKRTFDTSQNSSPPSSDEWRQRAKFTHETHGQVQYQAQFPIGATTHPFDQCEPLQDPSLHSASNSYHSAFGRSEDDGHLDHSLYGAARVYVFEDSALDTNACDDASPIQNLPVQAVRPVATVKSAPPPKPKRSKRQTGNKKAYNRTVASAPVASVTKTVITPSKVELIEAGTPRAQDALEVWYKRLGELHDFKKQFGHTSVPQKYPKNPSLGTWVNKQRMEYKQHHENLKSSMTQQKLQALQELDFDWGKRKGDTAWEQKFDELVAYKDANDDCLVPTKYRPNPALGRWVSTQRSQYKLFQEGQKSTMTPQRAQRLNNIGFIWCVLPH